ncbi:hypothetical protein GOBAR_AA28075 [Gossypium barbadense]|uniref:Uncharacterized protein n=1 Tax=Gossypium barbadense TaxID=3634 RepID=A0A2P5WNB2_GOSBA|nr:hypothetical protein GOBAR_AA28075 [Gossypium barbadense]
MAKISPTRAMINCHGRATWPWANLPKQHGLSTHPCLEPMAEPIKSTLPFDTPVPSNRAYTISSSRGKKVDVPASKKRKGASSSSGSTTKVSRCIDWAAIEQVQLANAIQALLTIDPWELFFGIIEPTYLELTMELRSTFYLQTMMTNYDDPSMVQFRLEEFKEENDLDTLNRHIHRSPSRCWEALVPGGATYSPSRSKASALPPSLRYLHAILAHTITGRQENTGIVNTHDAYFLRCMSHGHVIDLAYFIALAIQHQRSGIRRGHLHWPLCYSMSPQGISSMLSIRMIEKHQGTYPPQYLLAQSTEKEASEDIPNDVPPHHEDPPSQPPRPSHPVYVATSYADIFENLTRFEQ